VEKIILVLFVILLPSLALSQSPERLNILAVGQVMPGESPIPSWFDADPLVDYVLIPTDIDIMGGRSVAGQDVMEEAWRRFVRIYFPKTRDALLKDFDFFVFPDGYLEPFSTRQLADMRYAMENGLGCFVTMGGDLSGPTQKSYPGWKNSVLYDLMPVELNDKMKQDGSQFHIKVLKEDPPVLSMFVPLGIEEVPGTTFTYLFPKEGTTVWAKLVSPQLPKWASGDWLVSWRIGESGGIFWTVADDLDHLWWWSMYGHSKNEYAMDVFLNILLYSTGRKLPSDISMIHQIRQLYWQYNQEKLLLFSLLDFVDRFGANTKVIERQIDEVDALKEQSFDEYRRQDFQSALDTIRVAIRQMGATSDNAMKLKNRALMWVYITEWTAVTGTLFAAGFVTYSLLVRRRLYREVTTTRYRER